MTKKHTTRPISGFDELEASGLGAGFSLTPNQPETQEAPSPASRSWGDAITDTGRSLASGVGGLVKGAGTLYGLTTGNMDNGATELGDSVQQYWQDGQSQILKDKKKALQAAIDSADGTLAKAGTAAWETISDPALALDTVASNAATMIPGMAIGRLASAAKAAQGLAAASKYGPASLAAREAALKAAGSIGTKVAIGTGAVQQGADVSQDVYEAAMKKPNEAWAKNTDFMAAFSKTDMSEKALQQTKHDFALMAARVTMPAATAISIGANAIPGADMLERALIGGGAKVAGKGGVAAVAKSMGKAALGEGVQETLEEGGGAFAGNASKSKYIDPNQDLMEKVGENAGMGAAGGLLMGAGGGAFHGHAKAEDPSIAAAKALADKAAAEKDAAIKANAASTGVIGKASTAAHAAMGNPSATRQAPELTPDQKLRLATLNNESKSRNLNQSEADEFNSLIEQAIAYEDQQEALQSANPPHVDAGGSVGDGMGGAPALPTFAPNMGLPTADQIAADQAANPNAYGPSLQQGGLPLVENPTVNDSLTVQTEIQPHVISTFKTQKDGKPEEHIIYSDGSVTTNGVQTTPPGGASTSDSFNRIATDIVGRRDPFTTEGAAKVIQRAKFPNHTVVRYGEGSYGLRAPEGTQQSKTNAGPGFDANGVGLKPNQPVQQAQAATENVASEIDKAAHEAATSDLNDKPQPTDGQKEAGNYSLGHTKINGLDIAIENPEGSTRSGVDKDGKPWSNTMNHHYGYIKGSTGNDGDHVDLFVKPGTPNDYSGPVYVADQVNPDTGDFDEHKALVGFSSPEEAKAAYQSNYHADWTGLRGVHEMPFEAFKSWVKDGVKNKPLGQIEQVSQPTEQTSEKTPKTLEANSKPEGTATANTVDAAKSEQPAAEPAGAGSSEVDLTTVEGVARAIVRQIAANRVKYSEKDRKAREAKGLSPNTTPESEKAFFDKESVNPPSEMNLRIAAAIVERNPQTLINAFTNGNFEASEDVFRKIAGVAGKDFDSVAKKKSVLYKWANWTPEQIAEAEGDAQARKDEAAEKNRQDDLKDAVRGAWIGLDRLQVKEKDGAITTGQDFVLKTVASGFDKAHSQKKGAATIYGLTDGARFTNLKAPEFTKFVKASIAFGGLDKALAYVNPPKLQAPEGFVDRSVDTAGAKPETGEFGPILTQYRHDAQGAIKALTELQDGEAVAALQHPEVGDIDLVWGKPPSGKQEGYGLAKISIKHPEVLDDLQGFLNGLHKDVPNSGANRIRLVNEAGDAVVSLDWKGERKVWLLTAYKKGAEVSTTMDIADNGLKDDTARLEPGPDASVPQPAKPSNRPKNWDKNYGAASKIAEAMGIALRGANGKMKRLPELVAEIKVADAEPVVNQELKTPVNGKLGGADKTSRTAGQTESVQGNPSQSNPPSESVLPVTPEVKDQDLETAKALIAEQAKATGNPTLEGRVRKKIRDFARTIQDGSPAALALDIAATRLGMGEGNLKGLEFADKPSNFQSSSPAVQDFIDGKRDDAPTLEEVKAEKPTLSPLTQAMNFLMELEAKQEANGMIGDDRLDQKIRQQKSVVKELQDLENKPASKPSIEPSKLIESSQPSPEEVSAKAKNISDIDAAIDRHKKLLICLKGL